MINDNIKLFSIDIEEFKQKIYPHYLREFPEEERKSLKLIETSYRKGYTNLLKIENDANLIGFMIVNQVGKKGYVGLDYFAILPQYRNKGFGTKSLKLLIEYEKENKGIFIEIEKVGLGKDDKENLLREKRKKFYEKIDFKKLNFDLLLFDVIYTPYVFSNIDIEENAIKEEMFQIYEAIAGKERIEKNCKVIYY